MGRERMERIYERYGMEKEKKRSELWKDQGKSGRDGERK
jgi:hypothetical protein